jgi:hypothetical protein
MYFASRQAEGGYGVFPKLRRAAVSFNTWIYVTLQYYTAGTFDVLHGPFITLARIIRQRTLVRKPVSAWHPSAVLGNCLIRQEANPILFVWAVH